MVTCATSLGSSTLHSLTCVCMVLELGYGTRANLKRKPVKGLGSKPRCAGQKSLNFKVDIFAFKGYLLNAAYQGEYNSGLNFAPRDQQRQIYRV